ncbi:MAG TPA: mechanosensitive ion channel protein, partial [Flavobacteriaceae bacterium]|nr:mechanosensitive ion channel protein [Flavobacteriaceae bacterium]
HFRIIESAKLAFDKNGIEIPFPQRVVHQIKST